MRKRSKINKRKSKKSFTKGAQRVHKYNVSTPNPMRGGIRL